MGDAQLSTSHSGSSFAILFLAFEHRSALRVSPRSPARLSLSVYSDFFEMPTASRKELSEWAASLSGHSVSRELKELSTGVVLCHLVEAARPGSVEIRKLATMRSGSDTIANLKLLSVALERVDPSGELAAACDVPLLAKGQPQATLALLQKLHSYFNAENNAELAADGNSRSRSAAAEKKRTRVKPVDAAAEPAAPAGAETLTSAALAELQPALAARRAAAERRAAARSRPLPRPSLSGA